MPNKQNRSDKHPIVVHRTPNIVKKMVKMEFEKRNFQWFSRGELTDLLHEAYERGVKDAKK